MSVSITHRQKIRGLSLVEVMVAITISLILMAGAITLFVNNKVTYQVNDNLSRLQENARFGIDFMIRDLRMTGYFGCNNESTNVNNSYIDGVGLTPAAVSLGATVNPLEGFDETLLAWSPSGDPTTPIGTDPDQMREDTDAFTIRHLSGENQVVVASTVNVLTVNDASTFAEDARVAVSDCNGTDIFQIDTLVGETMTPEGSLAREYDTNGNANDTSNPIVSSFIAIRYFIGNGPDNNGITIPFLFREVILDDGTTELQALIEGVESMHILYGVDNNADNVPDAYLPAGDVGLSTPDQWESVVAVKIAMLVRTLEEYGQETDNRDYRLNDFIIPEDETNDGFKRRLFNTTVLLRNRLT